MLCYFFFINIEDNIIHYSDSALTQIFINNNNLLSKIITKNIYFVLSI